MRLEAVAECDPDPTAVERRRPRPCWRPIPGLDVFNEGDGRYLGRVPLPDNLRPPPPAFLEEAILMAVEDEAGTIEVKRFRLETPSTPGR